MKNFSRLLTILLLPCLALAAGAGCARYKLLDIDCKPSEASIYVNGEKVGLTRQTIRLDFTSDPTQRVLIQVVKPRYKHAFQLYMYDEVPEKRPFTLDPE